MLKDRELLWRVLQQARPYRWNVVGIFVLGLLATPLALLAPVPVKIAVDSVLGNQALPSFLATIVPSGWQDSGTDLLVLAAAMLVGIAFLTQLQWAGSWLLSTYTGERLVLSFRSRLFEHVQRLSLAYHDARGSTDATYRIQYDAPCIQWIVIDGLIPFCSSVLKLVGMLYVMSRLDGLIALVAVAISPVLIGLTRLYRARLRDQWREVKKLESAAMSVVQEVVGALRVVKAFGQEDREHGRFLTHSHRSLGARLRVVVSECGFSLLVGLTTAVGTACVLFIGVRHVQAGALSLGELLIVMTYLGQLYDPLKKISQQVTNMQRSLASAERALALLDHSPDVVERPDARPLKRASGAMACRNVWFEYESNRPVLRDVSFEIAAGTRIGIVGKTGAGKTTLINLLTRFYDPTKGTIHLDGVDLRDYRLTDLRRQFAIVLQEPVLLSASIGENIAYARPDATDEEIVAAAQAANAHEFIQRMDDGYQTLVGERGLRLSGGERQRISLARAFLRDAPILILDEPTSSVDTRTEAAIIDAMERLMDGRTTFMIAHRLTTLRNCDLLLVIEDGRIVSQRRDVSTVIANELLAEPSPSSGSLLAGAKGETA